MVTSVSKSDEMKQDPYRHASHEIKNNLASILALVEMLEFRLIDKDEAGARKTLTRIRERIHETTEDVTKILSELSKQ